MTANDDSENMVGPCTECAEMISTDSEACPECDHNARKHAAKHLAALCLVMTIGTVVFPPAGILTVPIVLLLVVGFYLNDWVVVDEDSIEPQEE